MRGFIGRLKCRLGLHCWIHPLHWRRDDPNHKYMGQECYRCGKVVK